MQTRRVVSKTEIARLKELGKDCETSAKKIVERAYTASREAATYISPARALEYVPGEASPVGSDTSSTMRHGPRPEIAREDDRASRTIEALTLTSESPAQSR
jgi:hypothetical protein